MSMRCRRGEWRLVAVIFAAGGLACSNSRLPPPSLSSIEPASALEASSLDVTIRGDHFFSTADRRLGWGPRVDSDFRAALGSVPLADVRWISSTELAARVPDTLPPGTHSLTVEAPNGSAQLPSAFVVIPIEHCANGLDDDGDGLVDCADPDCSALACDDGNPCTDGDVCTAGACSGNAKACTPPSACYGGGCDAGTCGFSVLVGASCVDPRPCTAGGTCAPDGTCVGISTCVAPGQCWSAQCGADGGCLQTVNVGQACTAGATQGTCAADGGCAPPPSGWNYFPSNFDPSTITPPDAGSTLSGCNAVFSTTTDAFVWSCGLQPTVTAISLSDGRQATVLAFRDLTVGAADSLTLIGQKPAIVAVYGTAQIDGRVVANSTSAQQGAGSSDRLPDGGIDLSGPCVGSAGGNAATSRAGGGGAGYRDVGGAGGSAGGAGGAKDLAAAPAPLRGGCPGGIPATGAGAGKGGGALQISASGPLTVSGVLSVSGAGGIGGVNKWLSGSGGGSGGTLVLEGDPVTFSGTPKVTANGGAGGGGCGQAASSPGSPGADGATDTSGVAVGGTGGANGGGAGGNGGAGTTGPVSGATAVETGGGGGGSAGAIFIHSSPTPCTVSPSAVISPPRNPTASCP